MKRIAALLLCLSLLAALCACGGGSGGDGGDDVRGSALPTPSQAAPAAREELTLSFPLISAPFSDAETEAMINHNCRSCALMIEDRYYCCRVLPDGGRELGSYQVIDGGLLRYASLVGDCGAEFLCLRGDRLCFLGPGGRPESMLPDGSDRRVELERECLSLQLRGDTLYCLTADGELSALAGGGGTALLSGARWAFVSDAGVFWSSAADGRAHLFDPASGTDLCLTLCPATELTVVGGELFYTAHEDGALRVRALDLIGGGERVCSAMTLDEAPEYLYDSRTGWALRFTADSSGGRRQLLAPCGGVFDAQFSALTVEDAPRRCRWLSVPLRLDELLDGSGGTLGFALVLPDGSETRYS